MPSTMLTAAHWAWFLQEGSTCCALPALAFLSTRISSAIFKAIVVCPYTSCCCPAPWEASRPLCRLAGVPRNGRGPLGAELSVSSGRKRLIMTV
jgi:hypothetical protein